MGQMVVNGEKFAGSNLDLKNNIVTFDSQDEEEPAEYTEMPLLESRKPFKNVFKTLSILAKNVRYLFQEINKLNTGTDVYLSGTLVKNIEFTMVSQTKFSFVIEKDSHVRCGGVVCTTANTYCELSLRSSDNVPICVSTYYVASTGSFYINNINAYLKAGTYTLSVASGKIDSVYGAIIT